MSPRRLLKTLSVAALTAGLICLAGADDLFAADKEKEAQMYAQDLKSKDAKKKIAALQELGKLGQLMKPLVAPAVPDMMKLLNDKDPAIRAAAADAVGMIDPDPKEAVPALLNLTKKEQPENVRMAALRGLAKMGPTAKDANSELRNIMKAEDKKSKLGKAAGDALKSINPKKQ